MLKKFVIAATVCGMTILPSLAQISQQDMATAYSYYEQAEKLSQNNQYSSAINELKKGLRYNPYDSNIRVSLINNHLLRATYYNNTSKEYLKAMNDLRSALFYLKYYGPKLEDASALKSISDNEENLSYLYRQTQIATNLKNRYQIAKNLKREGEFAASAYEFLQSASDNSIKEESFIQIGDIMSILGNHQLSANYYKKALNINLNKAQTHLKLAKAYDAMGEFSLANNEYNYTLQKADSDRALMLELESIWVKKIGVNPTDAEAHTNLGAVYQKLGEYEKALTEYNKAKNLNPKNLITRMNLATLYQAQKDYPAAIQAYDDVLQFEPNNINARSYKAMCLMELKQFEKATNEYKKILTLEPNNAEAKSFMLEAMRQTLSPEEMLENYANATVSGPVNANLLYDYAYELHKANRLDEAIANYQKVLELDSKNQDCFINLAQAYKQKQQFDKALQTVNTGLANLPTSETLKKYLSELKADMSNQQIAFATELYNQGKYAEALEKYMQIQPKGADVYVNIASCYQMMDEDKRAIEYYRLALNKEPSNADILMYLGQTYINIEDWQNAISYLSKARSIKPQDTNIKELYVYALSQKDQIALERALDMYSKGDYLNALGVLNNILLQNKNNAYAYYYRGLIYDAQKKYSLSAAEYQKTIALTNDIPDAYYSLAVCCEALSKFSDAYKNYQKYLSLSTEVNEYTQYAKSRVNELKQYAN